jgi:hypothetical protein
MLLPVYLDTAAHRPLLTYYDRLEQEALNLPRTGLYAGWHAAYGQPDETRVYREANRIIGKPNNYGNDRQGTLPGLDTAGLACPRRYLIGYPHL